MSAWFLGDAGTYAVSWAVGIGVGLIAGRRSPQPRAASILIVAVHTLQAWIISPDAVLALPILIVTAGGTRLLTLIAPQPDSPAPTTPGRSAIEAGPRPDRW